MEIHSTRDPHKASQLQGVYPRNNTGVSSASTVHIPPILAAVVELRCAALHCTALPSVVVVRTTPPPPQAEGGLVVASSLSTTTFLHKPLTRSAHHHERAEQLTQHRARERPETPAPQLSHALVRSTRHDDVVSLLARKDDDRTLRRTRDDIRVDGRIHAHDGDAAGHLHERDAKRRPVVHTRPVDDVHQHQFEKTQQHKCRCEHLHRLHARPVVFAVDVRVEVRLHGDCAPLVSARNVAKFARPSWREREEPFAEIAPRGVERTCDGDVRRHVILVR
mmetsp:Transcript_11823/g.29836  ORF Transcript_11823/g.29836 Transcript_11823/m.29836 type:complete len:278 (-) Transcript_11823:266-1099(-)